jgi:hypothetical protein
MSSSSAEGAGPRLEGLVSQAKELVGDDRLRVRLFDLVAGEVRRFCQFAAGDNFSVDGRWDIAEFVNRIHRYEEEISDLLRVQALVGHWTTEACGPCLVLAPTRLANDKIATGGNTGWAALRWYPALLLLYAGGIGAVASGNYRNLNALFATEVSSPSVGQHEPAPFISAALKGNDDVAGAFQALRSRQNEYVPRSEYLFDLLRQPLDDILLVGRDYERLFDRFEVLLTLEQAHRAARSTEDVGRAPLGRFAWKYRGHHDGDPFSLVVKEATRQGQAWPPLAAGLFGGSYDRFVKVEEYYAQAIARTGWY